MSEIERFNLGVDEEGVVASQDDAYFGQDMGKEQERSIHEANSAAITQYTDFPIIVRLGKISMGVNYTTIDIPACLGFVKIPEGQKSNVSVGLTLTFYSKKRQFIDYYTTTIHPEPGVWTPIAETMDVISEAGSNKNFIYHMEGDRKIIVIELEIKGLKKDEMIYIDDLGLYVHEK